MIVQDICGLSISPRVRARFLTRRSPVDLGIGTGDAKDTLEATDVGMVNPRFKEESEADKEDCWADAMDC